MSSWISTTRIAQMSGDYDPENLPHFNYTAAWGVDGVDLGASTEHNGQTYIFFGDVPLQRQTGWPPHNADLVAHIEDTLFPPGGHLAAERQSGAQLDVFFIGQDGALYVTFVIDRGTWRGPVRISQKNIAPPGGCLAAAQQSGNQLDVFFIGQDGALYVSWVTGGGIWQGPLRISARYVAPPGASVVAIHQSGDQLDVLYIGNDHKLNVHWVLGLGEWQGPVSLGTGPVAPPGAYLAAFNQTPDQLSVVFFGHDQKMSVHWVPGLGVWQGPVPVSPLPIAPPGACLAAIEQVPGLTCVHFIGNDRKLTIHWVPGGAPWEGPLAISPQPLAPPGGGVALVKQESDLTTALFLGDHGELYAQWAVGLTPPWQGPLQLTPANVAPRGAPLIATKQLEDLTVTLFGGPTNEIQVVWGQRGEHWKGPVRINPEMVKLIPTWSEGAYYPYMIREAQRSWYLGSNATPTGAFSYGGKAYVFAYESEGVGQSTLARSCCPGEAAPFDLVFRFSFESDSDGGKFFQVAPYVTNRADVAELGGDSAEGVILLGHGFTRLGNELFGVHLAWMPLTPGRDPELKSMLYYTGNGPHDWSPFESAAVPLFTTRFGWASISLGRIPGTGLWIMLRHTAGDGEDINAPIMARIAAKPWELAGAPDIILHDPVRDSALGRYMYRSDLGDPNDLRHRGVPLIGHASYLYGAFLLNQYTRYDAHSKIATLRYLVSTGWPYQVQLMESRIQMR
jgi:hypothetical protein